jgi:hypothetical protein
MREPTCRRYWPIAIATVLSAPRGAVADDKHGTEVGGYAQLSAAVGFATATNDHPRYGSSGLLINARWSFGGAFGGTSGVSSRFGVVTDVFKKVESELDVGGDAGAAIGVEGQVTWHLDGQRQLSARASASLRDGEGGYGTDDASLWMVGIEARHCQGLLRLDLMIAHGDNTGLEGGVLIGAGGSGPPAGYFVAALSVVSFLVYGSFQAATGDGWARGAAR